MNGGEGELVLPSHLHFRYFFFFVCSTGFADWDGVVCVEV